MEYFITPINTPKEEAELLINSFRNHTRYWDCYNDEPLEENNDVKAALICVETVISQIQEIPDIELPGNVVIQKLIYWRKVKDELLLIDKLK